MGASDDEMMQWMMKNWPDYREVAWGCCCCCLTKKEICAILSVHERMLV